MGISSSKKKRACHRLPFYPPQPEHPVDIIWDICLLKDNDLSLFLSMDDQKQVFICTSHCDFWMEKIIFVEEVSDDFLCIGTFHRLLQKNTRHVFFRTKSGQIMYEFPTIDLARFIQQGDVVLSMTIHLFSNPVISPEEECDGNSFVRAIRAFF